MSLFAALINHPLSLVFFCATVFFAGCARGNMEENDMKNQPSRTLVRRALGAGRWFPADGAELGRMVEGYIDNAEAAEIDGVIVGALAPHAGYIYSGRSAGHTYRAIRDQAQSGNAPDTVVVLGLSHRGGFRGIALMDGEAISTPLGEAALDKDAAAALAKHSALIRMDYAPHNGEWSAENQVPFLQAALPDTPLVIGIIGDHDVKTVEELVRALLDLAREKKILVVASSDMLHDPDYELVTKTDKGSLELVAAMKDDEILSRWSLDHQTFCGVMPLIAAMRFAKAMGCKQGSVLYYRNNGDDFPESRGEWVVGYGAAVFAAP